MTLNNCNIYDHIFSVDENNILICEKCKTSYMQYMEDIEKHLTTYRVIN
jgi:hypothetical protein